MSVKRILISQSKSSNQAPYDALRQKYGVTIDFQPFFIIEPLTSREFRAQRLNILDYTAIVFSARNTIDAFFAMCEELRVKVPETMKYFCTTEAVAVYLQKHIDRPDRNEAQGRKVPHHHIFRRQQRSHNETFRRRQTGLHRRGLRQTGIPGHQEHRSAFL